MTKTAHTPGPWESATEITPNAKWIWIAPNDWSIRCARVVEYSGREEEMQANAARIVACVNACEGIANPDVVPEAIDAAKAFAAKANGYDGIPAPKYFGDIDCDMRHPDTVEITFTLGQVRQLRAILAKLEGRS